MAAYFIGVDVGTASARAGVFGGDGTLLASARRDITLYREGADMVEQSSAQIWQAVCGSVREAVATSGVNVQEVAGIGFDATCSLVVLGPDGASLPVGLHDEASRDIILWMDHRAVDQARRINETRHDVLRYVGGRISPEMQTPKLLWLKENRRDIFDRAWQFLDLADFLTWKASGSLARSSCTVTCKWTYLAHERRFDPGYFETVGLGELSAEGFRRIGADVVDPGTPLGSGLTATAAGELALMPGTAVAAGLIDAHAGGVGTVGAGTDDSDNDLAGTMAYVFGTSSCTMTTTREPVFVPGIWGPYHSAMVPGFWLAEGGQSAAGAAIDHLVSFHPASGEAAAEARARGMSLPQWLARRVEAAADDLSGAAQLAGRIHVVPEFLGNRAPLADPQTRAVIAGLGMERDMDSLVALYVAGLCGLGYGLRQIIEAQARGGAPVERIVISGGAGRQPLVRQLLADASGLPVLSTRSEEPVLLGSAILAAVASGHASDIPAAMGLMTARDRLYRPAQGNGAVWHEARFRTFEALQAAARK